MQQPSGSMCPKCNVRQRIRPGDPCRECINEHRRKSRPVIKQSGESEAQAAYRAKREAEAKAAAKKERESLIEENLRLQSLISQVEQIKPPAKVRLYGRASEDHGEAVACALASDWHVEEPVEAHSVHGINEYNLSLAESRAAHFFKNFLRLSQIMARDCDIRTLWVGLLGDFFSGYIHEELRETNELAPTDAANFVLDQLCRGFDFLLKESDFTLEADAIAGNHGRMTTKPRIQNATGTSLETFMYLALARRYEGNPRVRINVAKSKMVYRRFFERFTMRVLHGDDVKFGGGVGGITIPIRKKLAAWDKAQRADLTVMGHFHQLMDGGDFLVNGSLIGYNEFAQAIGASPEEPRQAFFLVHARNGGEKSVVAPIWLDSRHQKKDAA